MITILNDYSIQNYLWLQTLYILSADIMTASSKQVLTINDKNSEISINHQKLIAVSYTHLTLPTNREV